MAQNQEFADFELDYDFEGTKEFGGGDFPLLPAEAGYIFEVTHVSQEENKNNKTYIKVEFVVAEEQDVEGLATFAGQKTWGNYYTSSAAALGRLKQLQIACGAPGKFVASAIMGARIRADIVHTESKAEPGPDGQPRPPRTFANIANERSLTDVAVEEEAPPPPPPATKAAAKPTTSPAATANKKNGAPSAARRA